MCSNEVIEMIIKNIREKGISRREFAKKVGCSERHIHYLETGQRGISLELADKMLKELEISCKLGK